MTRSGEKKPSSPSGGTGRAPLPKPPRGAAQAETFGRFVRNLARLEGGAGRSAKAGTERGAEANR